MAGPRSGLGTPRARGSRSGLGLSRSGPCALDAPAQCVSWFLPLFVRPRSLGFRLPPTQWLEPLASLLQGPTEALAAPQEESEGSCLFVAARGLRQLKVRGARVGTG